MEEQKMDIYSEAIKTIVGYHKRSLLDFIDAIERSNNDSRARDILGRIKGRVHNDLSQCTLNLGILLVTIRSGGDIRPFEDNLIFRKTDKSERQERPEKTFNTNIQNNPIDKFKNNTVIKNGEVGKI